MSSFIRKNEYWHDECVQCKKNANPDGYFIHGLHFHIDVTLGRGVWEIIYIIWLYVPVIIVACSATFGGIICGIEKWSYAEGFQFALGQMLGTTFNTFDEPEDYLYVQKSGGKFVLFMLQVAVVAITGTTIGLLMHTMDPMVENVMRRYKSRIVVFFLYLLLLVFLIILPTTSIAGFLHLIEGGGYNPTISRLITETTNARMQPVPLEAIGSKIFVFLFRIYNLLLVCYSVVAMGELVEEYYTRIVAYTENLQAPQRYDTGRVIRAPRGRGRKASILQPFLFCIFFGPALCIIVALPFMGLYMGTEGTKLWESFRFALGSLILTYFDNDVVMTDNKSQIVSFFYSFFILPVLGTIIAVGAAGLRPFWQMYCLKVNSWNIEDNARRAESTEGKFQAYWTFCVIWLPAFFVVMAGITGSWVANNEGWSNNEGFLFIIQNLLPSPCHLVGEQIQPATEDGSMVLQFIARVTGLAAIGALAAFSGEALEGIYDTYFDELFGSEITGSSARRQQRNPYNADDYPTSDDSEDDTDDDTSEASSDESSEEESSSSEDPELGGE